MVAIPIYVFKHVRGILNNLRTYAKCRVTSYSSIRVVLFGKLVYDLDISGVGITFHLSLFTTRFVATLYANIVPSIFPGKQRNISVCPRLHGVGDYVRSCGLDILSKFAPCQNFPMYMPSLLTGTILIQCDMNITRYVNNLAGKRYGSE